MAGRLLLWPVFFFCCHSVPQVHPRFRVLPVQGCVGDTGLLFLQKDRSLHRPPPCSSLPIAICLPFFVDVGGWHFLVWTGVWGLPLLGVPPKARGFLRGGFSTFFWNPNLTILTPKVGPPGLPPPLGGWGYPLRRDTRIFKKKYYGWRRPSFPELLSAVGPFLPTLPCQHLVPLRRCDSLLVGVGWAPPAPPECRSRSVVCGGPTPPAWPSPLVSKERQFNNPSDRNMRESREEVFAAPRGREELCLLEPLCNYQFCRFSNIPISYLYLCLLQRLFCFQPGTPSVGRGFSQHSLSNQPEISKPSELNSGPWWDETHPHVWCAPDCADRMTEVGYNSSQGMRLLPHLLDFGVRH